jgi:hypothetical protein
MKTIPLVIFILSTCLPSKPIYYNTNSSLHNYDLKFVNMCIRHEIDSLEVSKLQNLHYTLFYVFVFLRLNIKMT